MRISGVPILLLAAFAVVLGLGGCARNPASDDSRARAAEAAARQPAPAVAHGQVVRTNGLIRALEWQMVRVPQIIGTGIRLTLTHVVSNGSKVSKGDILVEFDRTAILDIERDNKARLDDIAHQLDQQKASVHSDATKRAALIKQAEADLAKAQLELRKGPILSDIDRLKNEARAVNAKERVESLRKSDKLRQDAERAVVRILELKLERQRVALERTRTNLDRLQIKAPQDGMVALENTWRNGSMGPSREGDQVWPGVPLLRIFNPTRMVVEATVNESDIAAVQHSTQARLYLDAYPGASFAAKLEFVNPVATSGMDSTVRSFTAVFRVAEQDPRLLPDLSAAIEIDADPVPASAASAPLAPKTGGAR